MKKVIECIEKNICRIIINLKFLSECIYFQLSVQTDCRGDENERGRKETIFSSKKLV
jgi:hypothetical protein